MASFFALLLRKYDESHDLESDHLDTNDSLHNEIKKV